MPLTRDSVLHYWSARYGPVPIIGGKPVHSRSSAAKWVDGQGIVQDAIVNTPRFEYATISGERRPVMRIEAARTNICLQSENFGTTWTANGSPTRTAAAIPASVMGVSLDLLGDDDGAAQEFYNQDIAFTGNGAKAISLFAKKGTSSPAGGSYIHLRDDTGGGADRLGATLTWNSDGSPNVVMDSGTYLGAQSCGGGVYRLLFRASNTLVAANANKMRLYPALLAAQTGNVYFGGVQIENASDPSAYVATTTAAATRATDFFAWDFALPPQALMMYARFVERGSINTTNAYVASLSNAGGTAPHFVLYNGAGVYSLQHHNGVSAVAAALGAAPSYGQVVELVAILYANGSVSLTQSLDGAAVSSTAITGAAAIASAWSDTRLYIAPTFAGLADYSEIKLVKYADVVAATSQGIMDELRAFELSASGEVIS